MNATGAFEAMAKAISEGPYDRRVTDSVSPCTDFVREAWPGTQFRLKEPLDNVPAQKSINLKWAIANVLQFFANTEHAAPLRRYNPEADRFLTGDLWIGAYGKIAVPQIRECVSRLIYDPDTRRAVVSMGGVLSGNDANRPACWCDLHFLRRGIVLDLLVTQRSLHLYRVMPYDCIALTNILYYAAAKAKCLPGQFVWTVGSLHTSGCQPEGRHIYQSILLPPNVLDNEQLCWRMLEHPEEFPDDIHAQILARDEEVRT